jgi:SAM-dependent methyltransferase
MSDAAHLSPRDFRGSPDRFGWDWNTYAEILPEYEEQFRRWTVHLRPEDWQGQTFLDVGCGMGRNSFWPMQYGAREGVAIDIDDRSLVNARRNLARFPSVQVLHASAYDLPFEDQFDIAFSIGVIHHLEFPERALARITCAVRPGGRVDLGVRQGEYRRAGLLTKPFAQGGIQPAASRLNASPVIVPCGAAVVIAPRPGPAHRIFRLLAVWCG